MFTFPNCRIVIVAWVCLCGILSFLCPVSTAGDELAPDDNTLFLAHYNRSVDADYSKGSRLYDRMDTVFLTPKGGYFDGGMVCRVGDEALKESNAERTHLSLLPMKAFDGVRYPVNDNLDLVKGTFECWIKPYFSISRAKDMPENWPMQYFLLHYRETLWRHLMIGINSASRDNNGLFFVITTKEGNVTLSHVLDWKPGTWHHVAVTWDTTDGVGSAGLFLDGRKAGTASLAPLKGDFLKSSGEIFAIGSMIDRKGGNQFQFYKADAVMDELRISNIARYQGDFVLPAKE